MYHVLVGTYIVLSLQGFSELECACMHAMFGIYLFREVHHSQLPRLNVSVKRPSEVRLLLTTISPSSLSLHFPTTSQAPTGPSRMKTCANFSFVESRKRARKVDW